MYNSEAVTQRLPVKKVFLEISQNSLENTCVRASFLIKLQADVCNFIKKEALTQVFSSEFCQISEEIFSCRIPVVAAFDDFRESKVTQIQKLHKTIAKTR